MLENQLHFRGPAVLFRETNCTFLKKSQFHCSTLQKQLYNIGKQNAL
jgi:hypothetical protein